MSNIYLIRHGFTPANNANYNNQRGLWKIASDKDMPLEDLYGVKQALELGEYLESLDGSSLVLVSPYKRAQETLDLALGINKDKYQIITIDELAENNNGIHYAKTKDEIIKMYPESIDYYKSYEIDPLNTPYIEGESLMDVRMRVMDVAYNIERISDSNLYDNILVFAHGTVNSCIFYWLNNSIMKRQKNCEVIKANGVNSGESLFLPETWVPKGYIIDVKKYINKT
jgi:broad specificity phosphatase PhoE